jgi:hypothetical protein
MGKSEIDKAVFYRLGQTQTYACVFYKENVAVGNFLDVMGAFISDLQEWLKEKYPNIQIEVQ